MMRFVQYLLLAVLLLATSAVGEAPNGRACPGHSVVGGVVCCLSGVVTLDGKAVEKAVVTAQLEKGLRGAMLSDETEYVGNDDVPTYGFQLHGAPLYAQPGDTLIITATYDKWTHVVAYKVLGGEQSLNIELNPQPHTGLKPITKR